MLRLTAAAALVAAAAAQGASWDAGLISLPSDLVTKYNARCLNGGTPGLFYRKGASPTKWKFHIQGGGWCTSVHDCYSRSLGVLGQPPASQWLSSFWLPEGAGFYGFEDNNATNPFGDFNFVWLAYCDGSSFTSDASAPISYNGTQLYMRGRATLDAHLELLERSFGFLSNASEVVVSGTSAGGLATYLHSGYIKSRLQRQGARLVALPDAGFFLSHAFYGTNGEYKWYDAISSAIAPALWNSTLRGGAGDCWQHYLPQGLQARCMFPQYLYAFLTDVSGIFVLQSLYDTANLGICFGMSCNLYSSCSAAEVAAIRGYHVDLLTNITAAQAPFAARDSHFLTTCYQHEESCRARDWYGITIGGQTANSTFYNWYTQGVGANSVRLDVDWPGDTSCAPQGFDHGAC